MLLYFNNLALFVWFGCDTEEQTEPEPFKYNLVLVLFLVLFDYQLLQVCIQTKLPELCWFKYNLKVGSVSSNKEIRARARTQTELATEPECVLK